MGPGERQSQPGPGPRVLYVAPQAHAGSNNCDTGKPSPQSLHCPNSAVTMTIWGACIVHLR